MMLADELAYAPCMTSEERWSELELLGAIAASARGVADIASASEGGGGLPGASRGR